MLKMMKIEEEQKNQEKLGNSSNPNQDLTRTLGGTNRLTEKKEEANKIKNLLGANLKNQMRKTMMTSMKGFEPNNSNNN